MCLEAHFAFAALGGELATVRILGLVAVRNSTLGHGGGGRREEEKKCKRKKEGKGCLYNKSPNGWSYWR
jgi:hypothetical protein